MDLKDLRSDLEILYSDISYSLAKFDACIFSDTFMEKSDNMSCLLIDVYNKCIDYHKELSNIYDRYFPPKPLSEVIVVSDE